MEIGLTEPRGHSLGIQGLSKAVTYSEPLLSPSVLTCNTAKPEEGLNWAPVSQEVKLTCLLFSKAEHFWWEFVISFLAIDCVSSTYSTVNSFSWGAMCHIPSTCVEGLASFQLEDDLMGYCWYRTKDCTQTRRAMRAAKRAAILDINDVFLFWVNVSTFDFSPISRISLWNAALLPISAGIIIQ